MYQLEDLNLNSLLLLHWLLEEKSVSRAAQRVGLSQPAASRSLQKLREVFGDELLIRTGRSYTLSQNARDIQPELSSAVKHLRRAVQPKERFDPATSPDKIVIAANDYVSKLCTNAWADQISQFAPQLGSVWRPLDLSVIQQMASGEIDFAILPEAAATNLPGFALLGDMVVKPLYEDNFVVFGDRNHPALATKTISIDAYLAEDHILVSPQGKGSGIIDQHLERLGLKRHIKHRAHSFSHAAELSLSTGCLVILPKRLARLYPRGQFQKPPFETQPLKVNLAWHASRTSNEKHKWFRRELQRAFSESFENDI